MTRKQITGLIAATAAGLAAAIALTLPATASAYTPDQLPNMGYRVIETNLGNNCHDWTVSGYGQSSDLGSDCDPGFQAAIDAFVQATYPPLQPTTTATTAATTAPATTTAAAPPPDTTPTATAPTATAPATTAAPATTTDPAATTAAPAPTDTAAPAATTPATTATDTAPTTTTGPSTTDLEAQIAILQTQLASLTARVDKLDGQAITLRATIRKTSKTSGRYTALLKRQRTLLAQKAKLTKTRKQVAAQLKAKAQP